MANWCENTLVVVGKKDELEKFKEHAKGENGILDANKFIPYPRELDELYEKEVPIGQQVIERLKGSGWTPSDYGYNHGGYNWCIENWGTKWNFGEVELVWEEDESLTYSFETAWSPPEPVIKKMGEMFPNLGFELEYSEPGVGFQGLLRIEGGSVVEDSCGDYVDEETRHKT